MDFLIHAVAVILVGKGAERFERTVLTEHGDGGMGDAIEGVGLHGGIVDHILEDHLLAYCQLMIETPVAHEISTQTTVATEAVNKSALVVVLMNGTSHLGEIWHLQAIGHVAREADIKNGRQDTLILYHINHMRHQRSRLPGKGTTRLKDDLQPRVTAMEVLHHQDQQLLLHQLEVSNYQRTCNSIQIARVS